MPEFARGLKLAVTDRDEFEKFIKENAHDPGIQMENWGHNSVPEAIYISKYNRDDPSYYRAFDKHVNGELSWNYWNENLLEELISADLLKNTQQYDVELVDNQED
jgi:hypothetical protein